MVECYHPWPVAGELGRRLTPAVRPLEDRQLLSGAPTATMTQTATFPNLESHPNVASQAFLYFSSTMGTLTEVDVVTSGSFSTQFSAENLGPSSNAITGTTSGNLSINVPSGAIPGDHPRGHRELQCLGVRWNPGRQWNQRQGLRTGDEQFRPRRRF